MVHDASFKVPISRVRLGAAPLGNLFTAVTDEEAAATLEAAVALGIGAIDTAPLYGAGLSERRVGEVLARHPNLAVSTKVGRRLLPPGAAGVRNPAFAVADPLPYAFDYSRAGVRASFAGSCERLGCDRVETLLLHDIGAQTHGAAAPAILEQALGEAFPAMTALKKAGACARIGLGVNEVAAVDAVLDRATIDVVLIAGRYTLLDQSALALLDRCRRQRVAVLAAGVFNSGLLAGGTQYDYAVAAPGVVAARDRMAAICRAHDVPLPATALAFTLAHPAVSEIVLGLRSTREVAALAGWLAHPVPPALWTALRDAGVIRPDAPTPC